MNKQNEGELRYWISALLRCKTLDDLEVALRGFRRAREWELEERAIVSGVYTPIAVRLLWDHEDKRFVSEALASLCWDRRKDYDIREI